MASTARPKLLRSASLRARLRSPRLGLTQLKECGETLDGRAEFPACGASLRIEHDWGRVRRSSQFRQGNAVNG